MMRVSTAGMNSRMISQALDVQTKYYKALETQSSGLKSTSLSGLDGQSGSVINLKSDIAASENLESQATGIGSELEITYSSMNGIEDIVEKALTSYSAAMDGTVTDISSSIQSSSGWLSDIITLLNTQYAGSYVFSGGDSQSQTYTSNGSGGYDYTGGASLKTLMIDGDQSLDYGALGNESVFGDIISALSAMSDPAADKTTLSSSFQTLSNATETLGSLMETVSGQSNTLEKIVDGQTSFQLYANDALESLTKEDVGTASAETAAWETVLQASYAALSSLDKINILNYL